MKRTYTLFQQYTAYALLISFLLQSCNGLGNLSVPSQEEQTAHIKTNAQQIILRTDIQPLVNQVLTAQGGHAVTLYKEDGALKADVAINAPQGFSKSYEGVNVHVEQGAQLSSLPQLEKKLQERRIHLQLAQKVQPAKVIIYKGAGLAGGGNTKDDGEGQAEIVEEQAADAQEKEEKEKGTPNEVVIFCGNPGVGKSALCNSIFQEAKFPSGTSRGQGLTTHHQTHMYKNRLYIDTPGLEDINMREQAAAEIEQALKKGGNYKIVFVIVLDDGRLRQADLNAINIICDAIKTPFEYGLVINKSMQETIDIIIEEGGLGPYLITLHKQPFQTIMLTREERMAAKANVYFEVNENRRKLLDLINNLPASNIQAGKLDIRNFEEKIQQMEEKYTKAMAKLKVQHKQEKEEQEVRITKEREEHEAQVKRQGGEYEAKVKEIQEQMQEQQQAAEVKRKKEREEADIQIKSLQEVTEAKQRAAEAKRQEDKEEHDAQIKRLQEQMEEKQQIAKAKRKQEKEEQEAQIKRMQEEMEKQRAEEAGNKKEKKEDKKEQKKEKKKLKTKIKKIRQAAKAKRRKEKEKEKEENDAQIKMLQEQMKERKEANESLVASMPSGSIERPVGWGISKVISLFE
ncbi:MAG: GTPase domain-containing protein [Candidatus Amoebophilus sp.]